MLSLEFNHQVIVYFYIENSNSKNEYHLTLIEIYKQINDMVVDQLEVIRHD